MKSTPAPQPLPTLRQAAAQFIRLAVLLRPYWGMTARGLMLGTIVGVPGLVLPYLTKLFVDDVYPTRDVSLMHVLVFLVAGFSVSAALMGAIRGYYTQVVSARMSNAVALMYFNRLQHLPIRFFDEHRVGEILSRVGDMRAALGTFSRVFETLLVSGVYLVLVPPLLIFINWKLSVLALISTPLTTTISTLSGRYTRRLIKRSAESSAEFSAIQFETLSQIRTLKVMGIEHRIFRDAADQTNESLRAQLRAGALGSTIGLANAIVRAFGTALFGWYAWTLILRGEMTLGGFLAFSAYLAYLVSPVNQIATLFSDFQQSVVTLSRSFEYLDIPTEQAASAAYTPAPPIKTTLRGTIELRHVTFGYSSERPVLEGVSMAFEPGTITAIVGTSGAGKSTVLRLLCRMERPTSGAIYIDGKNIEEIDLSDLRRQLAVVWQEPTLLRGSVWDNLTIGTDNPDRDRVIDIVHACRLGALVDSLPDGYESMIGEWGATLSGGQRQRLALARALVRDAPVLLLDEATSQIDARTEAEILPEVMKLARNKTVIFVTHRMGTASLADRIYVLDNGGIASVGSHDELTRDSALYNQMTLVSHANDPHRRRQIAELI